MKYSFLLFILLISSLSNAQDYESVDREIRNIPDSLTVSTQKIASYINSHFVNEEDKIRAVFYWTATNISYDVENMYAINFNESPEDKIKKALETKKGICMHYAQMFNEIANKAGIKSVLVEGYTMQNGYTDYIPHVWNGAKINGSWYVFDATWGSGYIQNGKFIRKINNSYFKGKPYVVINTHMPFDYLWQFMEFPITNQEFYERRVGINRSKPRFDFESEISKYESLTEAEQLEASVGRIEQMGVKNAMIFDRLAWKKRQLEYVRMKKMADDFSVISTQYNQAVNELNEFIAFRNKQFRPEVNADELKAKISRPKTKLIDCQQKLGNFSPVDDSNKGHFDTLKKAVDAALAQVIEHEAFVKEYLSKPKIARKMLFYRKN